MTQEIMTTEDTSHLQSSLDWEVPRIQLRSCDDVINEIHEYDDLSIVPRKINPQGRGFKHGDDDPGYECSSIHSWSWMSAGSVQIPGYGLLDLNGKAKQQLSSFFKVKWPEAFRYMPTEDMANYLRSYLKHLPEDERTVVKVVAREYMDDEEKGTVSSNGLLRGVVSPKYQSIPDSRVMDRMWLVAGSMLNDMAFAQYKHTDNGSHAMLVFRDRVELSGVDAHLVSDGAYFGCRMRNSDVGSFAFSMVMWLIRSMCSNGLIVGSEGEPLLYRQHRRIDNEELDGLISAAFEELPKRRTQVVEETRALHSIKIEDPVKDLHNFLRGNSRQLKDAVEKAYEFEPVQTAYGALQALTRVCMASRADADKQYDLEKLARSYIPYALKAA